MNKNCIDDVTLIRLFIAGRANFAANGKLRVQSALDTQQLLARSGQILAIARPKAEPPEIGVRPQSSYTALLDRTLRAHSFLPLGTGQSKGFARYRYHLAPEGYQLRCASARDLWREWWMRYRQKRPQGVQIDLLFFTQQKWYSIRDIVFSNSTLFVTTYRGETAHQATDLVVWAEKMPEETADEKTQFFTAAQVKAKAAQAHKSQQTRSLSQYQSRSHPRVPSTAARPERECKGQPCRVPTKVNRRQPQRCSQGIC